MNTELQTILTTLKDQWPIAEIKLRAALIEGDENKAALKSAQHAIEHLREALLSVIVDHQICSPECHCKYCIGWHVLTTTCGYSKGGV